MSLLKRAIAPLIILALVVVAAVTVFGGGSSDKTITAYFPSTVSLYQGSDVRVLGVPVGTVDSVEPEGTQVKVVIHYQSDLQLPSTAQAVIVSPSIVGDRYVQLQPAYTSGATLPDNATLDTQHTAVPLELDQIYSSLDQLSVALGPNGANKTGALTDLLQSTARNFGGQGDQFHQTIKNFSLLTQTLNDNKDQLFGSTAELQTFITKLANNDSTVRSFNSSLSRVSDVLSGDRQELAGSLKNLATALTEVGTFVHDNRDILTKNISGLNRVAKVLVKQRANLDETLRIAPLALNNLALTYNPDAGTLDTNANIGMLAGQITSNPKQFLCSLVSANDPNGSACNLIQSLPLPRAAPFGAASGSFYGDKFDPTLGGLIGGGSQ